MKFESMSPDLKKLVNILTCLAAVNLLLVQGQNTCCSTDNCCVDSCAAPPPLNITLDEYFAGHPHYVTILPDIPLFAGVDNVCYTSSCLAHGTYLLNGVTVYVNGLNVKDKCLTTQEHLGVFTLGTSSTIGQLIIFDYLETDDCTMFLTYLCFLYGDGYYAPGNSIPVIGLSSDPGPISLDCLTSAVALINNNGVASQNYTIVPYKNPTCCAF